MPTLPTAIPASITAGDTVSWTRDLAAYPRSAGWSLHYALVGMASVYAIQASAGSNADGFAMKVLATDSAGWAPGDYTVQEYATQVDGTRETVGISRITVLVNLALVGSAGTDTRSPARRIYQAISAVLEGRATEAELEVQVNGRTIKYIPVTDLLVLRNAMRIELANEHKALTGIDLSKLYVRFG
jgi:hypothetical protein